MVTVSHAGKVIESLKEEAGFDLFRYITTVYDNLFYGISEFHSRPSLQRAVIKDGRSGHEVVTIVVDKGASDARD
jgi:hypothetical protein